MSCPLFFWIIKNLVKIKKYLTLRVERKVLWLIFLPRFDVLRSLSEYLHTAKWNLFVFLYNKLHYACILIGSYLWSIRGQTHEWRHRFKLFPAVFFLKWRKVWTFRGHFTRLGERRHRKKSCRGCGQIPKARRRKKSRFFVENYLNSSSLYSLK